LRRLPRGHHDLVAPAATLTRRFGERQLLHRLGERLRGEAVCTGQACELHRVSRLREIKARNVASPCAVGIRGVPLKSIFVSPRRGR
jgi:hypothetical protein